jgi:hypothetical protein
MEETPMTIRDDMPNRTAMMEVEAINAKNDAYWWSLNMPFAAGLDNEFSSQFIESSRKYARKASRRAFIMYPELREAA